jgi:hypothetical protein
MPVLKKKTKHYSSFIISMKKINKRSVSNVGCFPLALSLTSSARQTRSTKKSKIKMRKDKKNSSSPSRWDPSSGWKQHLHSVQRPLCRASIFGHWLWTKCHPLGLVIRRRHVETLIWLWKGHSIWSEASLERVGVWNWKAIPFVLAQRTWAEYVGHEMPLCNAQ